MKNSDTCTGCFYLAEPLIRKFECRRFPQQANGRSNGYSSESYFQFPPANSRCGEYKVEIPPEKN
jgi:hypothetical protein